MNYKKALFCAPPQNSVKGYEMNRYAQCHTIKHRPPTRFLFIITLCVMTLASCTNKKESSTEPIRFAFQNRVGSAIPVIAVEKGFFADHGLNVLPLRFNNGPACAEALYSGSADVGTMGDTAAIICASRTKNLRMIASHSTGEHRHRVIVQSMGPYHSLSDLIGKRIGMKKGTSTYGGFLAAMEAAGIPAKEIQVIDLSPSTLPDALAAGSIDAFAASEPTPSVGEIKGGRELMTFGGMGNRYPIMMLAQSEFLKNREKETAGFVLALRDAERFVQDHPGQTVDIMAKATGLPLEVVRSAMARHAYALTMDDTIIGSLSETAVFLKRSGNIERVPDFAITCATGYL